MKLLIATRNAGKRREMAALLAGLPVDVASLDEFPDAPEVVEDGETLEANAAKKAGQVAAACGVHAVADDSGLFVDALDGRPGVLSARYAGVSPGSPAFCDRLLEEMRDVPAGRRGAHFRCCIAMADPTGRIVLTASGRCSGVITRQARGGGGFGYDPVFYYEPKGRTFAELPAEEKNAVSHRGHALAEFRRRLAGLLG